MLLYSNAWFAGGGGVYPIHIVSVTGALEVAPPPVLPPPPPPLSLEHDTPTSSTANAPTSHHRLILHLPCAPPGERRSSGSRCARSPRSSRRRPAASGAASAPSPRRAASRSRS